VEEYLETIGRLGEYSVISKGLGDPDGRWQAFVDLSQSFWAAAKTDRGLQKMGIDEKEAGEIMQAACAVIRMRVIPGFGKLHDIMRALPKYMKHGKTHLLEVSRNVEHQLPQEEVTNHNGEPLPPDSIDEKWKSKHRTTITRNLIKAREASESSNEKNAPLTLLSEALKKLNHENMVVDNIDPHDLVEALKRINKIRARSEDLKKEIFASLDRIVKPGAILATNTSALDVNGIAAATARPEDVIGMHFFSPANIMRLLEVVRGEKTAKDVIHTSMTISKQIGKVPVLVGVCRGFVGNRILFQRQAQAQQIILAGARYYDVDRVLYDFGFPMGPFAMSDLAGLDIGWNEKESASRDIREILCESGRRGQKNGRGYYVYDPETRASAPDPEVEKIISDFGSAQGHEQREVGEDEILERCLYPMVNEGAKILEEGIAIRPSDIDVIWVNGYGWPVYRGGPMHWGDSVGLGKIATRMREFADESGSPFWQPTALLAELADAGKSFSDWRAG